MSPSTVTREVKTNRKGRPSKSRAVKPARKCARYPECRHARDVCGRCAQTERRHACRLCNLVVCADVCKDFAPRVCELLGRWPYLCRCDKAKRAGCDLPKYRYDARYAHELAQRRLSESRAGISVSQGELDEMLAYVIPLIRDNGLSPEAIWLANPGRFPVGVRTFYAWMESGVVRCPPSTCRVKVRAAGPQKRKAFQACPADLDGHEYRDFPGSSTPKTRRGPWRWIPWRARGAEHRQGR